MTADSAFARALRRIRNRGRSASALRGWVDTPREGIPLASTDPVVFAGWALDGDEPAAAVDVIVGGRRLAAKLGASRPDVPACLGSPQVSAEAGWTCVADLSEVPAGSVRVRVVMRSASGISATLCDRAWEVVNPQGLPGVIEVPESVVGSILTVRGHALMDGACPATVDVEVGGVPAGRARTRLAFPHLATREPAAAFAGFEHAVVVSGGEALTTYRVDVVVTGADGTVARLEERQVCVTAPRLTDADRRHAEDQAAGTRRLVAAGRAGSPSAARGSHVRPLVFTHQLDLGGGQLYLQELLRRIAPSVAGCTVVSPVDGELRHDLERLGMRVVVTGAPPPADIDAYEGDVRTAAELVLETEADVVLVNTLSDFPAIDAAKRAGVPSVWAIHESFAVDHWLELRFGEGGPHPYVTQRLKAALASASRLVFEAEATSRLFGAYAPPERRRVIRYGVEHEDIAAYAATFDRAAARRRHGIAADATVLLCVGTVEERKAQAALVEAFNAAAASHPEAVLVLVGDRPGPYSSALRRLIDSLDPDGRVRLLPGTREIWEWYALADVLVSASDVESLPRSMIEAMSFGTPVLAASVFGVPELVRNGESGWLFEARDMRALTAAMRGVLDLSPKARRAAGATARADMEELHRTSDYGRAYLELFRELVPPG